MLFFILLEYDVEKNAQNIFFQIKTPYFDINIHLI